MDVEKKLNKIMERLLEINRELKEIHKKVKQYRRQQKRAKIESAKKAIEDQNILPLRRQEWELKKENADLNIKVTVIENAVLRDELHARESNEVNTVTKLDNSWRMKLKFMFSSMRRFGNFTGYVKGRLEETDNILKNIAISRLTSEKVERIKEEGNLKSYYKKYEIDDTNKKEANNSLKENLIYELTDEKIDKKVNEIKESVLQGQTSQKSDRESMIRRLMKDTDVKKSPQTKYLDTYNNNKEDDVEER